LRDGQSFALAGLLDNSETKTMSKVPGLGDIPVLGNLFRSTQFQKNESELMFIVTTQIVKPVNRDDLPKMPAVESLKKGSLLGGDPKIGITGPTGFITNPSETPKSQATSQPPAQTKPANSSGATEGSPAVANSSPKSPNQ
jgi:pilus assembly protein CpaC